MLILSTLIDTLLDQFGEQDDFSQQVPIENITPASIIFATDVTASSFTSQYLSPTLTGRKRQARFDETHGYTVELILRKNGNLPTRSIDRSQF